MKRKVVIFGGTGFLGLSLADYLTDRSFGVVLVARKRVVTQHKLLLWDGHSLGDWADEFNDAFGIINLAGRSVDCVKTPDNCDLILRSRVESVRIIGCALAKAKTCPKVWIQMSTAHIYGDPPFRFCDEEAPLGYGLAPQVGKAWETEFDKYLNKETRGVILRTGFVIGKNGGALQSLSRLVKLGLGGKAGEGKQGMSWIHQTDFNEIVFQALMNSGFSGVYNITSPNPVSNKEFMKSLRKTMKVPFGLSAPEFITRLGAKYIFKTDPELALYGRFVTPDRLLAEGFKFKFPDLNQALQDLLMQ
ncbi:epimerase [Roseivirga spongicola]|uniref:Epimerase n=1 Tax=Roseivirga spongicola TaxID=333140 RepID=A0A150XAN0_9BACT|nr:TIGR01777 family oxidoreductase [Roseivirga spongicola]KYG75746.1 epimerase [Roseivirga spongicola]